MSIPITGISSMATRQLLTELVDAWHERGGTEASFAAMGGVDAAKRVLEGAAFDVVVLASEAIDKLAAAGRVLRGTETGLARSGMSIAVRRGAARPGIETEDALRRTALAARSIGYSTGPSGVALQALFERWGIGGVVGDRLVQASPGVPVGTLIARGDVDLGFQQLSELMHLEGVDVIGPMPPGMEIVTTFAGAVCTASAQPEAARALIDFFHSPAADAARQRHGMQPA